MGRGIGERALVAAVVAVLTSSCSGDSATVELQVELRTDYAAGTEFTAVRTEADPDGAGPRSQDHVVTPGESFERAAPRWPPRWTAPR